MMIRITFTDGKVRKYPKGITPAKIVKGISHSFSKRVLSASLNGQQIDLYTEIFEDSELSFYTWDDPHGKKAFWHSSAHLLAQAILNFYPKANLHIGNTVENGFYYDFGVDFSKKYLHKIEKKMMENALKYTTFKRDTFSKNEALVNKYKIELQEQEITFCTHGDFTDLCLCQGGHIPHTGLIKIINTSGCYWKVNEQLTRIYGISFPRKEYLEEYLLILEETKKRDHSKLGKELGLFIFSERVGSGLPLWLPKGTDLLKRMENFLIKLQSGYEMVITPHIGHKMLYETSGHWEKYGKNSFKPIRTPNEGEEFLLRPMNCPHHCEIYRNKKLSYRDLPKRLAEFGTVYRYEKSGELHGITRTRSFTQDDAHIFCTPDQLSVEIQSVIDMIFYVFRVFGFKEYTAKISLRDNRNSYIGSEENWKKSEEAIIHSAKVKNLKTILAYGEAAFYGPKLDFMVKDSLGRNWQLGTIQVDYNLPECFDLYYKGIDNKFHRPVIIHRAHFGSLERFSAILLEHTGGNLPLWLAPTQVILLPIKKKILNLQKKF
jgi:threonyl-tRNA synthetase